MPTTIVSPISAEMSSSIPVSHKPKNTADVEMSTVAITDTVNAQFSNSSVSSSAESRIAATNTVVRSRNDFFCCE